MRSAGNGRKRWWDGEFGTYDEWARLDHSPRTGAPRSLMLKVGVALLNKSLFGHGTTGDFQ